MQIDIFNQFHEGRSEIVKWKFCLSTFYIFGDNAYVSSQEEAYNTIILDRNLEIVTKIKNLA